MVVSSVVHTVVPEWVAPEDIFEYHCGGVLVTLFPGFRFSVIDDEYDVPRAHTFKIYRVSDAGITYLQYTEGDMRRRRSDDPTRFGTQPLAHPMYPVQV
jgi:hypothetical protein